MNRQNNEPRAKRSLIVSAAALCVAILLLGIMLCGCDGVTGVVVGSGKLVTTEIHKTGFTRVKATDSWDVTVVRGDDYSVKVTSDDNMVDRLDVTVDDGVLLLRLRPVVHVGHVTLKATVVMPTLDGLGVTDASTAAVAGFSSGRPLTVTLQDSAAVLLKGLVASSLVVRAEDGCSISGSLRADESSLRLCDASDATLSGATRVLMLQASSGSSADLGSLRAQVASVTLSDGSDALVSADGTLSARLRDGSDLKYAGSPKFGGVSTSDDSSLIRIDEQGQ